MYKLISKNKLNEMAKFRGLHISQKNTYVELFTSAILYEEPFNELITKYPIKDQLHIKLKEFEDCFLAPANIQIDPCKIDGTTYIFDKIGSTLCYYDVNILDRDEAIFLCARVIELIEQSNTYPEKPLIDLKKNKNRTKRTIRVIRPNYLSDEKNY